MKNKLLKLLGNKYLHIFILALIGSILFISFFSNTSFKVLAFELDVKLDFFNKGLTEIYLPPLGIVRAETHNPPLKFIITLTNVNLNLLEELSLGEKQEEILSSIINILSGRIRVFIVRNFLLTFIGGSFLTFLFYKRPKDILLGGTIGIMIFAIILLSAFSSYDETAFFINPEFEGVLQMAPWIFGLLEESLEKLEDFSEQMDLLIVNLYRLFERIQYLQPLGAVDGDIKVLHVSDIHNHPVAYDFIKQIVENFAVDLVIDTGDISDYGTPLEGELLRKLETINVPYIFIPGNHDSPAIIETMESIDNVFVLINDVIQIAGVTIAGIADPASETTAMAVPPKEVYLERVQMLEKTIEESNLNPFFVVSHHPIISEELAGKYPVLLQGHTHSINIYEKNGSIIINPGTSGAAGIRGLLAREEVPYSVVLMHLKINENETLYLAAVDIIKVYNLSSGFILERKLIIHNEEGYEIQTEGDMENSIIE
ncbi:metallophosphoesterase family protein [Anaerobranca gottschalkii]|uniref:Calcineurin-like phosphoesterase n=1 Tax=Anaerobranca gottschalkii DSM 13577 TaxID=1120990 RepID=A0A1H9Z7R2_9FIRM|nr:metallophosphoesterase [Anaerobranca gottschalkii]SES77535.1 Calcineurin-like phosphoesterase [Anaerobranca gottschalkii DSM 13577]